MIDISNNEKTVDLINVIIVKPGYQQHIIDNVRDILNQIAKKRPGFISSTVYKSLDGTHVVYFIRWRNSDDGLAWFETIRDALKLTKSVIEKADYHLYEVVETISL